MLRVRAFQFNPTIKLIRKALYLPLLQRRSLYFPRAPTRLLMGVWKLKKPGTYVWCLAVAPRLVNSSSRRLKDKSLCAMLRFSLFEDTAFGYPCSEAKRKVVQLHVVRLPATSLGLYKLASWRLESYFSTDIHFLIYQKNSADDFMIRPPKIPKLQRNAESVLSPHPSCIKTAPSQKQQLHFYTNLLSCIYQNGANEFLWEPKNVKLSVHDCACASSSCLHKSVWSSRMTRFLL